MPAALHTAFKILVHPPQLSGSAARTAVDTARSVETFLQREKTLALPPHEGV